MDHPPPDVAFGSARVRLNRDAKFRPQRGAFGAAFLFARGAVGAALAFLLTGLLVACGGGGGDVPPASALPDLPARKASAATPVAAGCTGGSVTGSVYANAEVEPFVAAHPGNPNHLLGAWQQDRWSNGGARALVSAVSLDGGATWARTLHPMSRCGGAAAGSAGDFERATDPWVDIGPDGTAYAMGLAFNGGALLPGSTSAMLASRSVDGGLTWSAPTVLVRDGSTLFNDKNTITADPTDARLVYAVWDRLDAAGHGPALIARSSDSGATWEPARAFYTPSVAGAGTTVSQTIGNRIVVITAGPERGTLVNVFNQIDSLNGISTSRVAVMRSADKGLTWSAPVYVSELRAVGARDPATGQRIRDGSVIPVAAAGPDGALWLAWQDARFSAGQVDAIALSRSGDGGRSWSAPVAVNKISAVHAFTPTLHVRADGLVGLMHYDLRSNSDDVSTLLADAWLLSSRDGITWSETRVHGPFDMAAAPDAGGLFLGDYHGLVSAGTSFLPLLVLSSIDTSNRTDVYAPRLDGIAAGREQPLAVGGTHRARAAGSAVPGALSATQFRAARSDAIAAAMERRMTGWRQRVQGRER